MAEAGVGGKRKAFSMAGGSDWARSTIGVRFPGVLWISTIDPSRLVGFAGNVTKGPSRTDRLLGGRPRSFPVAELLLLDHADDTAGPCFRRARGFALEGVMADMGSSKKACPECGVTAERG
jgi:hypothetical protein